MQLKVFIDFYAIFASTSLGMKSARVQIPDKDMKIILTTILNHVIEDKFGRNRINHYIISENPFKK